MRAAILSFTVLLIALGFALSASAQVAQGIVQIAPHRAIYDISLDHAAAGSGISDMNGRMVYEVSGSACDGYTQNMRFVTRITDRNGAVQVNDMRSSSWEGGAAERLRFHLRQYRDHHLTDSTEGDAGRDRATGAPVEVHLSKPSRKNFQLKRGVYFPIQHSIALIQAAKAGRGQLTAQVYDGSDKGEKVFLTSAYIGTQLPSSARVIPPDVKTSFVAKGLPAWPVSISFFEPGGEHTDAVPAYELSFRFFENGISTGLHIDYGDFSVRGKLRDLKLLSQSDCAKSKSKAD